jgi:dihydroflavonol-4-reductase
MQKRRRKMKTLVTGATGFIGSSLVRELLKDGVEVKVLVRKSSDTRNIDGLDIERVYGDIRDDEAMKIALKGCDTLYQLAALIASWAPNNKVFYDINVEGTKTTLNAALKHGVEKVVYTSSAHTLGAHGIDNPANENAEFNLWDVGDHYTRSKYLGELEARKFLNKGMPLVIVNPTHPIGVRDIKPSITGQTILNIINRQVPGYFDAGANIVDVDDVVRGHILAAQKGRVGERYILGNENITMKDYCELIGEVSGVEPPRKKMRYSTAITVAYFMQFISSITKKPPLISPAMVKGTTSYVYYDCSKAVTELGLPQTPVRTALEKAVNWFRENGYVKGK